MLLLCTTVNYIKLLKKNTKENNLDFKLLCLDQQYSIKKKQTKNKSSQYLIWSYYNKQSACYISTPTDLFC